MDALVRELREVLDQMRAFLPLDSTRLWDFADCAVYFKCSTQTVRRMFENDPDFPAPSNLPTAVGAYLPPRFFPEEIKGYAEFHHPRRSRAKAKRLRV